jgi:hypothetical protein
MSIERYSRRRFNSLIASAPLWPLAAKAFAASTHELLITQSGLSSFTPFLSQARTCEVVQILGYPCSLHTRVDEV